MQHTPLITGLALATPLGNTLASTWQSLCAGNAILDHSRVPHIDCAAEPRMNTLARRVAREALADAGWSGDETRSAALIVGTSKGPVDAWLASLEDVTSPRTFPPAFGLAETAAVVASDFGIIGPRLTVSAACASGLHALIRAAMTIRAGEVRRALVVAAESSLHPLFIASFNRLGVISPKGQGCRPFDRSRAGFVVSEAAAAICLEAGDLTVAENGPSVRRFDSAHDSTEVVEVRSPGRHGPAPTGLSRQSGDVPIFPAIERFAMGADATHLTGGDPQGAMLRHVLNRVIDSRPIDLIHAHGTGTLANDPIELSAIESSLPEHAATLPSLYSHKAALGHSLGAAGLVAVVINALCHRHGIVPPNIHTRDPLESDRVAIRSDLQRREVRRSLAIAAGFGGAIAAVTLVDNE